MEPLNRSDQDGHKLSNKQKLSLNEKKLLMRRNSIHFENCGTGIKSPIQETRKAMHKHRLSSTCTLSFHNSKITCNRTLQTQTHGKLFQE